MKLVRNFQISEVHATTSMYEPFKLLLGHKAGDKCELILDKAACKRHGINPKLELAGRTLECTLTPRTLRRKASRGPNKEKYFSPDQQVKVDEVWLVEVVRTEKHEQHQRTGLADKKGLHQTITHTLYAESDDGGGGSHLYIANCPLYYLVVYLTKEEYKKCIKLPQGTVLKTQFRLLPQDKAQKRKSGKAVKK